MISQGTRDFWFLILLSFNRMSEIGWDAQKIVQQLRLAAQKRVDRTYWDPEMIELDDRAVAMLVNRARPGGEAEHWQKLLAFLKRDDVQAWEPDFTLAQLRLVAEGERGVELHDNCSDLPLF